MSESGNGQTKFASVADLFGTPAKRRHDVVTLPISGHTVRIQSLTEREVSNYQAATLATSGTGIRRERLVDANRRLIVLCLVDESGNRLLNETHISKLADWDAADTQFLYDRCSKHCGLNTRDVEDLVKNSETIPAVV